MLQHRGIVTTIAMWTAIQFGSIAAARAATEPSTLFKTKCSSCHTFGKGDSVGPDLKGVTERHPRSWLIAWIRSSETQIRRRDPVAESLFRKYRQQRMPDHDLTDAQIGALLDYLHAGGPAADEQPHLRLALDATPLDVQLGRKLFFGETRLAAGSAAACVHCHALSQQTRLGGSLAPDLTAAFARYLDWELDQRLRRPCMPASGPGVARVDEVESLQLRAFLRSVGGDMEASRSIDGQTVGVRVPAGR